MTLFLSGVYFFNSEFVQYLTLKSTDIVVRVVKSPDATPQVVTVAIDYASIGKYGQWPWPRYRLARLLQSIKERGATSIGIDIIFPEPDRTSLITLQETLKNDFGYIINTSGIPDKILDHDIYLANSLKNGPYTLGYEFLFNRVTSPDKNLHLHPVYLSYRGREGSSSANFHKAKGVICNYHVLEQATSSSGFLNGTPDIDGVLRRLPLLIQFDEKIYPSFALSILMQYKRHNLLKLEEDDIGIHTLSLADLQIPTDNGGNYLLGPPFNSEADHFSAADVLEGKTASNSFTDKIVLVGLTAPGLQQVYPTSQAPATPLLDIHKHSIQSLLSKFKTIRTPRFLIFEIVTTLLLCFFLASCIAFLSTIWSSLFCLAAACSSWLAAAVIYQKSGLLFSPFLPTISIILNSCLLLTLKFRYFQLRARSEAENALVLLKSSEERLRSILNFVPDIVFRLDKMGKFTFISPAISKYSISSEKLIDRSIFELVAPEDLDKARCRINERRTGERATTDLEIQLMLSKRDNHSRETKRFFSISAEGIYLNSSAGPKDFLGTQGIIRDISDRKQLEHQLVQAQKMEVIGNLASGIAHDLNNILSGLVSYPDLLLMEIPKDNPLHEKVSVIQKSGKKAAVIVQDLLTLARRSIDINDIYNMNNIITEYLGSIEFEQFKARFPQTSIRTDLQENLLNGKGSSVHLSKVIMNIIHNGLEAMPAGGDLVLSTTNTYVDSQLQGYECIPEGEYICTVISDNGVGIPKPDLKRIFEPFYTKKSLAKSGTGLGMTVIWATVKDHKGYIDIKSEEGQGTTLKIYLPTTRETAETENRRIVIDDYLGSESILVVDDIPEQLNIVKSMLSKLGYSVFTAVSGEKAIETIKQQPVELVILDMIMPPGLDGLETYEEITRLYPNQKAIITSGFSESKRVKKLQDLGVQHYVQKPYTMEKLGMAVRSELDLKTE